MKQTFLLILLVSACLLGTTSCLQDKCGNINCENGGVCVDGQCACKIGFEGDFCEEPWYSKFLATWNVEESSEEDTVSRTFQLSAVFGRSVDTMRLTSFADSLGEVFCVRKSSLSFSILEKEIDSTLKITTGEGTVNSLYTKVTGVYSFKKGDKETTVNFTWTK